MSRVSCRRVCVCVCGKWHSRLWQTTHGRTRYVTRVHLVSWSIQLLCQYPMHQLLHPWRSWTDLDHKKECVKDVNNHPFPQDQQSPPFIFFFKKKARVDVPEPSWLKARPRQDFFEGRTFQRTSLFPDPGTYFTLSTDNSTNDVKGDLCQFFPSNLPSAQYRFFRSVTSWCVQW